MPAITPKSAAPTENQMGNVKINKTITRSVEVELERVGITSNFFKSICKKRSSIDSGHFLRKGGLS
jgi:hypothetical protein